jgi:hypothetical protein
MIKKKNEYVRLIEDTVHHMTDKEERPQVESLIQPDAFICKN